MNISIQEISARITETLSKHFGNQAAIQVAEYLIWAEMSGIKTQGIIKMTGTEPMQNIIPAYDVKIERETKLSVLLDAGKNPAPLAAQIGTDIAIKKAKESGFAIVGIRNTFSSNGAQAFYVEKIAKSDLIGFMCSRSPASTTAFESIDPLFGTNPFGMSFPSTEGPVVFDMATSAMTFYGLVLAKARGESIPENMAIDENGVATIDPKAAMAGALLPFDRSYKGSALSLFVEMLAGPLVSAAWVDNQSGEGEWGSTILAIDPNLLIDVEIFKRHTSDLIERVRSSRKKAGCDAIRLPGERARASFERSRTTGFVEIDDAILKTLGYL